MSDEGVLVYRPTGERVELVGIANEGQEKPGDPGRGMRLYAVRTVRERALAPQTFQASAEELYWRMPDGKSRPFSETALGRVARRRKIRDAWALLGPVARGCRVIADGETLEPSTARAFVESVIEARTLLREVLDDLAADDPANS